MTTRKGILAPLTLAALLAGCSYDEGLTIENMVGTVVLPPEAAQRSIIGEDGNPTTVTDARGIGPVYLGLYTGVTEGAFSYPHPVQGPPIAAKGDTYPYGGTSIGDLRYACLEALQCRVVSGRFLDFDDMVDYFNSTLSEPIKDAFGEDVESGDYIRQTCYTVLNVTSDDELRLTATRDNNNDGKVDAGDLDFVERSDGNYEADFTLWQQEYFDNQANVDRYGDDYTGFTLWGFLDRPDPISLGFSTCDPNRGYQDREYSNDFFAGVASQDLLNKPSDYIEPGDMVAGLQDSGDLGYVYETADDVAELWINVEVTQ